MFAIVLSKLSAFNFNHHSCRKGWRYRKSCTASVSRRYAVCFQHFIIPFTLEPHLLVLLIRTQWLHVTDFRWLGPLREIEHTHFHPIVSNQVHLSTAIQCEQISHSHRDENKVLQFSLIWQQRCLNFDFLWQAAATLMLFVLIAHNDIYGSAWIW